MSEEIKTATVIDVSVKVICPYCEEEQETYYESGETDTCLFCNKEFEVGEL